MFNWYEINTEMEIAQERYRPLRDRNEAPDAQERGVGAWHHRWQNRLGRLLVAVGCALQRPQQKPCADPA